MLDSRCHSLLGRPLFTLLHGCRAVYAARATAAAIFTADAYSAHRLLDDTRWRRLLPPRHIGSLRFSAAADLCAAPLSVGHHTFGGAAQYYAYSIFFITFFEANLNTIHSHGISGQPLTIFRSMPVA